MKKVKEKDRQVKALVRTIDKAGEHAVSWLNVTPKPDATVSAGRIVEELIRFLQGRDLLFEEGWIERCISTMALYPKLELDKKSGVTFRMSMGRDFERILLPVTKKDTLEYGASDAIYDVLLLTRLGKINTLVQCHCGSWKYQQVCENPTCGQGGDFTHGSK